MVQMISEKSFLESQVKPLLELANTERWKSGLNILYLSSSILRLSEQFVKPCLVSASGPYTGIEDSLHR